MKLKYVLANSENFGKENQNKQLSCSSRNVRCLFPPYSFYTNNEVDFESVRFSLNEISKCRFQLKFWFHMLLTVVCANCIKARMLFLSLWNLVGTSC